MIVHILEPLHAEYVRDLKCHRDGQTAVLYWHGDRAAGSWYQDTVTKTLGLLSDASVVSLLGLKKRPMNAKAVFFPDDPGVARDKKLLEQYAAYVVHLSANRCWSQQFWTMTLPYALAGLFATDTAKRARTQKYLVLLTNAIIRLEELIKKDPKDLDLHKLRSALSTCDLPLVREIMVVGSRVGFNWQNAELRSLCFSLFGGPGSTKDALEAAFNHVKDSVKQSKAKKFDPWTKFFYVVANPYIKHCGVEQIRPTVADFQELLSNNFKDEDVTKIGVWELLENPPQRNLPKAPPNHGPVSSSRLLHQSQCSCSSRIPSAVCREQLWQSGECMGRTSGVWDVFWENAK